MAIPLGIQHVLAMFVSNITPATIIAGVAGFGFGSNSPDFPSLIYMIQMSMLFAGIATLFQSIGIGPVGAKLPIVHGTVQKKQILMRMEIVAVLSQTEIPM